MRCCSISKDTDARTCSRMPTCRGRWAGSPACSRCGSIPARSSSDVILDAHSRPSRSSCARCRTMASAMGCCAISMRRPRHSLPGSSGRRSASTISAASRPQGPGTGPLQSKPRRSAAAAIPRCRSRTPSRSMHSPSTGRTAPPCKPPGHGRLPCCRMRRCTTWRSAGSRLWKRWHAKWDNIPSSPASAAARPATCRWWRWRRPRSSGWSRSIRRSRTSCRCRRCRRGCCSMRSMMRRRPTSTPCNWCSRSRAGSTPMRLRPRHRPWWHAMRACARPSRTRASPGRCRSSSRR